MKNIEGVDEKELAVYIGLESEIKNMSKSMSIYTVEEVSIKSLNREDIDFNLLAKVWYESATIGRTRYTPVFYIKNRMGVNLLETCLKFQNNYNTMKTKMERMFLTKTNEVDDKIDCVRAKVKSLIEGNAITKFQTAIQYLVDKFLNNCLKFEDFREEIRELIKIDIKISQISEFKKAITIIDYYEFEYKGKK